METEIKNELAVNRYGMAYADLCYLRQGVIDDEYEIYYVRNRIETDECLTENKNAERRLY